MIHVEIKRSRRKSIAIEIRPDLSVIVRAPAGMPGEDIKAFVYEKEEWIRKNLEKVSARIAAREPAEKLTQDELRELADRACSVIPPKAAQYAERLRVSYGRITIRNQKTRWGSCSAKGNLNFNCLLMLVPDEIVDYVVVHELCHRIEMNHSKAFWKRVEGILPDYRERRKWLKIHGAEIMNRMTAD